MKILILGEARHAVYELALSGQLTELGHECVVFGWSRYFADAETLPSEMPPYRSLLHRLEDRLAVGPHSHKFNTDAVNAAADMQPDALMLFNAKQVTSRTVRAIQSQCPGVKVVQYNNDNPFSAGASWSRWRHVRRSVSHVDLALAHRVSNLRDLADHGARRTGMWRSACTKEDLSAGDKEVTKDIDVLFAGHYEPDGRAAILEGLLHAGIRLQVNGGGWQDWATTRQAQGTLLSNQPLAPLFGSDYRDTLARAKVAICFLSSLNEDTYTRRSFEIPAVRTAQLSQYSDDLASLFVEDREIVFFRSPDELLRKINDLLLDPAWRRVIEEGGRRRVETDGHDLRNRAIQLTEAIESMRGQLSS